MNKINENLYIIVNIKTSINNVSFWNQNRLGYTQCIGKAGLFRESHLKRFNLDKKFDIAILVSDEVNKIGITMKDLKSAKKFKKTLFDVTLNTEKEIEKTRIIDIIRRLSLDERTVKRI